jgi:hypothetical protein
LKEEALDRSMWRNRFRRGFGPVVGQNTEWMNLSMGANYLSEPRRCSNVGWKPGGNRNIFCEERCCIVDPRGIPRL